VTNWPETGIIAEAETKISEPSPGVEAQPESETRAESNGEQIAETPVEPDVPDDIDPIAPSGPKRQGWWNRLTS